MMSPYLSRVTWLHHVPATAKLIGLALIGVALLPVQDWRILAGCLAVVSAIYLSLGREAVTRMNLFKPLLPLLLVIGGLQAFAAGWSAAATVLIRLVVMIMLANLVTLTTTISSLMEAILPLLRPLRHIGLSPKKLSLAITLVVRFVPVLFSGWKAREDAWRSRSGRRLSLHVVAAFIADTLKMADHVAEALDARGFDRRRPE